MSEFFIVLLNRSLLVSCFILALAVFRLVFQRIPRRALMYGWTWVFICFLLHASNLRECLRLAFRRNSSKFAQKTKLP